MMALAALALAASSAARGQSSQPLEQGISDVGPLGTSLRWIDPALRQPTDFEQVYRSSGPGGRLMRMNGAVTAVFGRSQYDVVLGGDLYPIVPADTVFYIGPPPQSVEEQLTAMRSGASGAVSPNRVSNLVSGLREPGLAAPLSSPGAAERARPRRMTVWSDEAYRCARVEALLRLAGG